MFKDVSATFFWIIVNKFLKTEEKMKGSLPIYVISPLEHVLKFFLKRWKYFYLLKVRVRLEHKNSRIRWVESWDGLCCALVVRVWFEFEVLDLY